MDFCEHILASCLNSNPIFSLTGIHSEFEFCSASLSNSFQSGFVYIASVTMQIVSRCFTKSSLNLASAVQVKNMSPKYMIQKMSTCASSYKDAADYLTVNQITVY